MVRKQLGRRATELTIEEYMAELIARTKNVRSTESQDVAASVEAARRNAARTVAVKQEAKAASAKQAADMTEDGEWKQTTPPECRDAISELRELANINTRSSFNVHRGQQLVYEMHNKLTVSLVALVVSFALTTLAGSMHSPAFFAAVAALIVAMCWTVKYFQLGRHLSHLCFKLDTEEEWLP